MENQHRHITGYRDLTEEEIAAVNALKKIATEIGEIIQSMSVKTSLDQRCVSLARTKFQEGFMWAVRAVTKPETFG